MNRIFLVIGLLLFGLNSTTLAKNTDSLEDAKLAAELQALKGKIVPVQYPKLDSPVDNDKDYNLEIGNGWRLAPQGSDRKHPIIVNGGALAYTPTWNSPHLIIETAKALARKRSESIVEKQNSDPLKTGMIRNSTQLEEKFTGCNFHVSNFVYKSNRLGLAILRTCFDTEPATIRLVDSILVPEKMGVVAATILAKKISTKEASENLYYFQSENGIAKAFISLKYFDVNFCPYKRVRSLPQSEVYASVYQFKLLAGRIQRYTGRDYELLNPNFSCGEIQ